SYEECSSQSPTSSSCFLPANLVHGMAHTIFICAALVFLFSFSDNVTAAARIRVLEFAVCFDHLTPRSPVLAGPASIPEQECKIPAIQQKLATLRAWLGALEALPSKL